MDAKEQRDLEEWVKAHLQQDRLDGMVILEKIASKTTVVIYRGEKSGRWHLETEKLHSNDPIHSAFDMSLPLAIAKLAQQVFSDGAS